ncbi:hypothetical protein DNTS_028719 [Danionella cerebrum]|uniref:Xyloside xylosyltransferase 1 n=1 Tax=Danionella cerebrum TaxID=2873325 RepID=A0A553NHG2_9TELE|nr:hypothetical protein DNTS_028719 [Danionella translucida]
MGVLRVLWFTMGRISTFRSYQIILLLTAALAVVAFYYFGSEKENFSSTTKRIKETQASHNINRDDVNLSMDIQPGHTESRAGADPEGTSSRFHALMMFTKVDRSLNLQQKFEVAMRSLVKHGQFLEKEILVLHFVSDIGSQELGERVLPQLLMDARFRYEVLFHNVDTLTEKLFPIVEAMQKHFSAGSGAYYSDAIFFLSVLFHNVDTLTEKLFPIVEAMQKHFSAGSGAYYSDAIFFLSVQDLKRVLQLDLDLRFRTNIRELFLEFNNFTPDAVIGIANEMQPVYR